MSMKHLPDLELLGDLGKFLSKLVVDLALDKDTRTGTAGLTVVEADHQREIEAARAMRNLQDTLSSVLDSLGDVGVLEDDVGPLSTELEGDFLPLSARSPLRRERHTLMFDLDASSMTLRPTGVLPVNATLSTFLDEVMAFPTVGP